MTPTDSKSADASGERPPYGTKCARCDRNWTGHQYGQPLRGVVGACDEFVMPTPPNLPAALPADERDVCKRPGCGLPYEAPVHGSGTGFGTAREAYRMHPFAHSWADERERITEAIGIADELEEDLTSSSNVRYQRAPKLLRSLSAEVSRLRAELAEARDEAVHNGFENDSALNRFMRFIADELGQEIPAQFGWDDGYDIIERASKLGDEDNAALRAENERLRAELVNPHG